MGFIPPPNPPMGKKRRRVLRLPQTDDEWQNAIELADWILAVHNARRSGIEHHGPSVDVDRVREIITAAQQRGFKCRPGHIRRLSQAWNDKIRRERR